MPVIFAGTEYNEKPQRIDHRTSIPPQLMAEKSQNIVLTKYYQRTEQNYEFQDFLSALVCHISQEPVLLLFVLTK